MNETITVIDKNGNNIVAEGIACIQFVSSGKKYILYTLNEKVENDLTKMYVGEIGDTVGQLDKINDEEWLLIKTTLNGISHGETNPDLKYLNMNSIPLNIGIPKKLAIKPDVKQAFNDRYNTEVMKAAQAINPDSIPAAQTTSSFFNNDVVGNNDVSTNEPAVELGNNGGSIFENPMQPDLNAQTVAPETTNQVMQTAPAAPVENSITASPVIDGPAIPTPTVETQNPVLEQVPPVTAVPETTVVQESVPTLENPIANDISNEVMADINANASIVEVKEESPEPVTLEQMMPANQVKEIGLKLVTKEEVLEALDIITRYINQNGGSFNGLAIDDNTEITMKAEEVSVPNHQVEDTSNEESVVPTSELSTVPESLASNINLENNVTSTVDSMENPVMQAAPVELATQVPVASSIEAPQVGESTIDTGSPTSLDLSLNTPEMVPTIDVNSTPVQPMPDNNFINMGVDGINEAIAANTPPTTGDALQITGSENLINLDAIPTIPEVDLMPPVESPTALTSQPISNAYVNSDPSGIPVTLPNNYNTQGANINSSVLGPGSLPTDNNN